jgi:ribonuclease P protein component
LPVRKNRRLTDSPEFERVYRQGTAVRGKLLSVHAFANDAGTPRLGLSVSRKVGTAVTRNTVKRRLREIFNSTFSETEDGIDFVVSARPRAADASYEDLRSEFRRALEKLGRIERPEEA